MFYINKILIFLTFSITVYIFEISFMDFGPQLLILIEQIMEMSFSKS